MATNLRLGLTVTSWFGLGEGAYRGTEQVNRDIAPKAPNPNTK